MRRVVSKRKLSIISASLLLVIACLCSLIAAFRVEILYLGQGRSIVFFNDWYEIDSCLRVFQVRENFVQVRASRMIEFCDDPIQNEYEVIYAENGDLIGVLDHALDSRLLVMYDFTSGQYWPGRATDTQRADLFERLKKSNPELQMPDYWQR